MSVHALAGVCLLERGRGERQSGAERERGGGGGRRDGKERDGWRERDRERRIYAVHKCLYVPTHVSACLHACQISVSRNILSVIMHVI